MDLKTKLRNIPDTVLNRRHHDAEDWDQIPRIHPQNLDFMLNQPERYFSPRDHNNIPMRDFPNIGPQYVPTRICAYGLAHWNRWLKHHDANSCAEFERIAMHLIKRQNDKGLWTYDFDWAGLRAPWASAMAQGEAVSVISRMDAPPIDVINDAIAPMHTPLSEGGFLAYLDADQHHVFLEEYPSEKPAHVLNGCLYAVIGLIDAQKTRHDDRDHHLLEALKNSLEANIHRWDHHGWSTYDLADEGRKCRNVCTLAYHICHVTQLRYLAAYWDSDILLKTADQWDKNANQLHHRLRAVMGKIIFRLRERWPQA